MSSSFRQCVFFQSSRGRHQIQYGLSLNKSENGICILITFHQGGCCRPQSSLNPANFLLKLMYQLEDCRPRIISYPF